MPKDTSQIVVGANGTIRVAPIGTVIPASVDVAWAAGWVDLGFTSEDGVTFTDSKTLEPIPVWQLLFPARRVVTERDVTAAFVLRQWSSDTVPFAFGGGTIVEDVIDAAWTYTPPDPEVIDERMLGVEWLDGDKTYRLIMGRGMVTENVETNLVRNAAADLPITFGVLGEDGVAPFRLQTDDPAFAAA